MATNTRAIRSRIKSVKNTRKITKAMELVSASKMRRAVSSVLGTRPFTSLAWETVRAISAVTDPSAHPLLAPRSVVKRVLFIVFTSDRGLCGGFNSRILKETIKGISDEGTTPVDIVTVGRRGADAMRRMNKTIVASFVNLSNKPLFTDILPVARLALDVYKKGEYDKVVIAYNDYVSAITNRPNVMQLMPLKVEGKIDTGGTSKDYLFEPDPQRVLDSLLPRIVESMIWQALLESSAAEHSARMMAMRSASDAAADMISSLTFTFNQVRQAGITREIAEISGGKAALE